MITLDQAIDIVHASALIKRDALLVLLATDSGSSQLPAAIKTIGKKAGVKAIADWNISQILGASKGQAVPSGEGWLLSQRGRNRVTELAQIAGMDIALKSHAVALKGYVAAPTSVVQVFIGHGGSPVWKDLREFLEKKLGISHDEFNRVSTAGITNVERIEQMLRETVFAFIILTAEDEQKDGRIRARQNVVHEVGLFQGRHGFKRAIVLLEEGCEEFSNINGLTQIRFPKGRIMAAAEEIRDVLKRKGVLK